MKIELEIDDEEINKYIKAMVKQQLDKRLANYCRTVVASYWTEQQVNEQIKAEASKNIAPQVEKALGNWEKIRPKIMDAAEKAIVNRTSRMIKRLEEA